MVVCMKKLKLILKIIILFICIGVVIGIRVTNIDMSEFRLFIEYIYIWLGLLVIIIFGLRI